MKLKQRVGDFRVRELLVSDYLREHGGHRVYRVTKRKLTTPEAVRAVADLAGVQPNEVSIAGLKDRQGITIQHASVPRGRDLRIQEKELKVETAGFADEPVTSRVSRGNAFEIGVRALTRGDTQRLRDNLPRMRDHGVVNYFDDQRFGNLEFNQGWILIDLMLGRHEEALKRLLTGSSERDDDHHMRFKAALAKAWGDWRGCRDVAGKYGAHHSIFEHLAREPEDFLGAFEHVSTRVKTIHLFAYQSHLWNRAAAELVRAETPVEERVAMPSLEGPLVSWADAPAPGLAAVHEFPLPGPGLDDVQDPRAYALLEDVLAQERLVPDQLRIEGASGFHLKGELRPFRIVPQHLRVRPPENDVLNPGLQLVRVRFELPRGAYATLVVKRLLAHRVGEEPARDVETPPRTHAGRGARGPAFRGGARGAGQGGGDPWGNQRQGGRGARGDDRQDVRRDDRRGDRRDERRDDRRDVRRDVRRDDQRGNRRDDQRGDRRDIRRDDRRDVRRDDHRDVRRDDHRGDRRDDRRAGGGGERGGRERDRDARGRGTWGRDEGRGRDARTGGRDARERRGSSPGAGWGGGRPGGSKPRPRSDGDPWSEARRRRGSAGKDGGSDEA